MGIHAVKFARWQHFVKGRGARFAVSVVVCDIVCVHSTV